jgi:hypothetical protein
LDKGIISRIYKSVPKIKHQMDDPFNKETNELSRWFSKEVQMANKYKKKYSTSLAIKEMQIKTAQRFHLIS